MKTIRQLIMAGLCICLLWSGVMPIHISSAMAEEIWTEYPPMEESVPEPPVVVIPPPMPEETPPAVFIPGDVPPPTPAPTPFIDWREAYALEPSYPMPTPTPAPPEGEGIMPPIAGGEDMLPMPAVDADADMALGEMDIPAAYPGDTINLYIPFDLRYMGQHYFTNMDAIGLQTLPFAPGGDYARYEQTPAVLLDYLRVVPQRMDEGFPLDMSFAYAMGDVIENGENHGYAQLENLMIRQDAAPGRYTLPVTVYWRTNEPDAQEMILHAYVPFDVLEVIVIGGQPEESVDPDAEILLPEEDETDYTALLAPWQDGVIVYTDKELKQAIAEGTYGTIYLGYSDENQGVIRYTAPLRAGIGRSLVIDGNDPLTGTRMQLVDWNSSVETDGLYASASGIAVTIRNMDFTGHNWYGVMYGTARSNVTLTFENVRYTGRQLAHNSGANSTVIIDGCSVMITNVGSGGEEEVAETTSVTLYGNNDITRTGPQTHSLFWLKGTASGGYNLTIADGATVALQTTNYMVYTDQSSKTYLHVNGALNLTTTGTYGSATYGDMYFAEVNVAAGGSLSIVHQNAATPTLQAQTVTVGGRTVIERYGSNNRACIRLEQGGSLRVNAPSLFLLHCSNGGLVNARSGQASVTWTTQAINRFAGAGMLKSVWNNADMTPFSGSFIVGNNSTSVGSVSGLYGGRGDALGASDLASGNLNLQTDGRFVLGRSNLRLDTVYAGQTQVAGVSSSGAVQEIREYAYQSGQLGALLQSVGGVTSGSGGHFSTDGGMPSPIQNGDSRVYAISDDGPLQSHTYTDPIGRQLSFLEVPGSMLFHTAQLSGQDQLVQRIDDDWTIRIFDPSDSGEGFTLTAHIDNPLTTAGGQSLPQALVFVRDGAMIPLDGGEMLIARGRTDDGIHTYDINWAADEGILIQVPGYAGIPYDPYWTTIHWTLTAGP